MMFTLNFYSFFYDYTFKGCWRKTGHGFLFLEIFTSSPYAPVESFSLVCFNEIVNLFTQVMMDHGATNEFVKSHDEWLEGTRSENPRDSLITSRTICRTFHDCSLLTDELLYQMMMNALTSAKSVNVRKLGYMTKISNPLHYHHFPSYKVPELWLKKVFWK